ncbi:MAG: DUF2141 domain-containing protein [Elusimicrobia bacterium]|jgi:uncharacterized protein (DUF2141 family)|nr:DUF2141 domain-containing protein [Elusimicrobiota bacterium]
MAGCRFNGFFCVALLVTPAAWGAESGRLNVTVDSVADSSATLRVCLFTSPEGFPGDPRRAFHCASVVPVASSSTVVFDGVPFGPVAVSTYQDMNGNGTLDKNFIGIPLEPLGVSGTAPVSAGKPRYEKAAFPFNLDGAEVRVELRDPRRKASP